MTQKWVITRQKNNVYAVSIFFIFLYSLFFLKNGGSSPVLKKLIYNVERCKQKKSRKEKKKRKRK